MKESRESIKKKQSLQAQASHLLAKAFPLEYGRGKIKKKKPKIIYGRNF